MMIKVHVGSFGVSVGSHNDTMVLDVPVKVGVPLQVQFEVVPIRVYETGIDRYTVEIHMRSGKARVVPDALAAIGWTEKDNQHRFTGLDIDNDS
ncbi:MAG: hypothetical protein ACXAC5_00485 [Promethearchaeota archaeon]|jgi:hypothetical protein